MKLGELPQASLPLLRSTFTHPEATERMRAAMTGQMEQAAAVIPGEDADLRAALILAILFGVSAGRNLIELGPLRDTSPEQITELLRPCFEVLTGAPQETGARETN